MRTKVHDNFGWNGYTGRKGFMALLSCKGVWGGGFRAADFVLDVQRFVTQDTGAGELRLQTLIHCEDAREAGTRYSLPCLLPPSPPSGFPESGF